MRFCARSKMVKQKIVLKLALDDERKRRKAFKAAVGMSGVTSAMIEGDKIIIIGDGVDPITLTTMLRRSLGYAELLSMSSGGDKKKDGYGYGSADAGGSGMSFGGKESGGPKGGGGYSQNVVAPITYPAYQQYSAMPSYPVYSYPAPAYQHQEQDPSGSIM